MAKGMEFADNTNVLDGSGTHAGRFNIYGVEDSVVDITFRNDKGEDVVKMGYEVSQNAVVYNIASVTVTSGCIQCSW